MGASTGREAGPGPGLESYGDKAEAGDRRTGMVRLHSTGQRAAAVNTWLAEVGPARQRRERVGMVLGGRDRGEGTDGQGATLGEGTQR